MLKKIVTIIIIMACTFSSYATAESINQSSWSQAEIRHEQAMKKYKATVNQIPGRLIQLTKQHDANVINDQAYRQGIISLTNSIFEAILLELDTSIELDKAFLKALDDGAYNTQKGQEILSKQHKKIVQNRKENEIFLINNSFAAILEKEIAEAYGDDAVPFSLKSKAAEFSISIDRTLKRFEHKLSSEYAKLVAAGNNMEQVRNIIKGSLKFKANISSTLSDLAEIIAGFQPLDNIPNINAIARGAMHNINDIDENISVIGNLLTEYIDSLFGEKVTVDIKYDNEHDDPDTLRKIIKDLTPYGGKSCSKVGYSG